MGDRLEFIINRVFRYMLFLSSYLPLFIILFLMNITNLILCITILALMTITILTLKWYLDKPLKTSPNYPINLERINNRSSEALNYIVTYIVPFISFNSNIFDGKGDLNIPTVFAFLLLFLVIGNLYMNNNLYYINPTLSLLYDINVAKDINGRSLIIVSEKGKDVPLNSTIFTNKLSPGAVMYVEKSKNTLSYKKLIMFLTSLLLLLALWNKEFNGYILKIIGFVNIFIKSLI
jgi:hypothetical protein